MQRIFVLIFILASILIFPASRACADSSEKALIQVKSNNLSGLIDSMAYISEQIKITQRKLDSPDGRGQEKILGDRIEALSFKLSELNDNFDLLATGVSLDMARGGLPGSFDWNQELKVLIGPLIKELQDLTLRPREIEKLRSDIAFYEENIDLADVAVSNLKKLIKVSADSERLNSKLKYVLNLWENRRNEWISLNNIAVTHLEHKSEDSSITKSLQDIPRIFFKSHGRNMIIALAVFLLVCFGMIKLLGLIKKYSPIHSGSRSFYSRLFDLSYVSVSSIIAVFSVLSVLYLFSDWVLLSVLIVFIFGIAWASKHALPKIWVQAKLVLNLGPVKEGEVVVYKGLLYRVISINLYTTLNNPLLQGGFIRVPISEIAELCSRPSIENEPWFPTKAGDWVVVAGENLARVETQTPETVRLRLPGGAEKLYPVGDFLSLSPMNLGSGFRVWGIFGLDYRYQAMITKDIPEIFQAAVFSELSSSACSDSLKSVVVNFKTAAQSSLDLVIIADFDGAAGRYYNLIARIIQRACVNVCNERDWVVPFMQMTVHMEP